MKCIRKKMFLCRRTCAQECRFKLRAENKALNESQPLQEPPWEVNAAVTAEHHKTKGTTTRGSGSQLSHPTILPYPWILQNRGCKPFFFSCRWTDFEFAISLVVRFNWLKVEGAQIISRTWQPPAILARTVTAPMPPAPPLLTTTTKPMLSTMTTGTTNHYCCCH